ncbi:MAG: hypothetical protein K6A97_08305 [Lachnospiraceae bacterium]|nr:hypothetical protein [Lachnospiraceae bacterium]
MINVKKILTKAVATLTCAAMLASNGLMTYAAENVTRTSSKNYWIEDLKAYVDETDTYCIFWDENEAVINPYLDAQNKPRADVGEKSVVTIDGKVYKFVRSELDKESGITYYFFEKSEDDSKGDTSDLDDTDPYLKRLAEKIKEIYAAQFNKSLKSNNHVEYREGDGIRYDMMEALSNTKGVVLDFYFTYKGEHYHATMTSEKAQAVYKKEIEVYGPQFILANFPCEVMNYDTK